MVLKASFVTQNPDAVFIITVHNPALKKIMNTDFKNSDLHCLSYFKKKFHFCHVNDIIKKELGP